MQFYYAFYGWLSCQMWTRLFLTAHCALFPPRGDPRYIETNLRRRIQLEADCVLRWAWMYLLETTTKDVRHSTCPCGIVLFFSFFWSWHRSKSSQAECRFQQAETKENCSATLLLIIQHESCFISTSAAAIRSITRHRLLSMWCGRCNKNTSQVLFHRMIQISVC